MKKQRRLLHAWLDPVQAFPSGTHTTIGAIRQIDEVNQHDTNVIDIHNAQHILLVLGCVNAANDVTIAASHNYQQAQVQTIVPLKRHTIRIYYGPEMRCIASSKTYLVDEVDSATQRVYAVVLLVQIDPHTHDVIVVHPMRT